MNFDDKQREIIRSLTHEQLRAKMPEAAARFYAKHPQLLEARRLHMLGEDRAQADIVGQYFATLPPVDQYMIVAEMAHISLELAAWEIALQELKKVHKASYFEAITRFTAYGINIHLSREAYECLLRALETQGLYLRQKVIDFESDLSDNPDNYMLANEFNRFANEKVANAKTVDELIGELKKSYPSLVKDTKN